MRRIAFLAFLATLLPETLDAQNRSIDFEQTKDWKEIVQKAKEQKKMVFVDCYTSWCGPCKMLARDVFTKDEVADYFNEHFICAKFDMEKDSDGVMLRKQFEVKAFPTLVFVDPSTGDIVHRMVGGCSPERLIDGAKQASDPDNNLNALTARYRAGERGLDITSKYASALFAAYKRADAATIATDYLRSIPMSEWNKPGNWALISRYVDDPLSPVLQYVMAHRKEFYPTVGQKETDGKLGKSIAKSVEEIVGWKAKPGKKFDEERNKALKAYLEGLDFEAASIGVESLNTSAYARQGDYQAMLEHMKKVMDADTFSPEFTNKFFLMHIAQLSYCGDPALIQQGLDWIDRQIPQATGLGKGNLYITKARLLAKKGDKDGAARARETGMQINREAVRQKNKTSV